MATSAPMLHTGSTHWAPRRTAVAPLAWRLMKRLVLVLCSVSFALPACRRRTVDAPDDAAAVVSADASRGALPEHGGVMALAANLRAEVVSQPDGRVLTYVTTPQGAPMQPNAMHVALRKPDGQVQAVPVTYDPASRAYVGRAAGVPPGPYPVQVSVQPSPTAAPVQMLTAPVNFASTVQPPAPRHGGQVTVVGDRAVEVAVARSGDVAAFWTDLDGAPIAPGQIEAPSLVMKVAGEDHPVALHPSGEALVGHFNLGAHAQVDVGLPSVSIGGAVYLGAEAPHVVVVPTIPGAVFVARPVAHPVAPAVLVAQPAPPPPTVVIAQPAPPPPTVVIARPAPQPNVLVLQPNGWGRRGHREHEDNGLHLGHDDDHRGRGGGHGGGRGRGH